MLGHWLHSGWRSLIANPLFSLITIISLSIGCAGALMAGSNIKQHVMFERGHVNVDRIGFLTRLQIPPAFGMGVRTDTPQFRFAQGGVTLPLKPALEGKLSSDIEAQTRVVYGMLMQIDQDEQTRRNAIVQRPNDPAPVPVPGTVFVDNEFFTVFPMKFLEGSAAGLDEPYSVVISQRRAELLFGKEPAVGKTVKGVRNSTLKVIGVVENLPLATVLRFDTLAGMRTFPLSQNMPVSITIGSDGTQVRQSGMESWNTNFTGLHYVLFKKGVSLKTAIPQARQVVQNAADIGMKPPPSQGPNGMNALIFGSGPQFKWDIVPLAGSHLLPPEKMQFTGPISGTGDIKMVLTLATGALALLIVSAFNYVTLSLARSLRRRREVAVRKVLGASQSSLVTQYLVESAMVTAISIAIGFAIAWFLAPWFARAIGQPEALFDLLDPVFLAMALGVFAVLAIIVGAYPAFYLSSVRPRTGLGEGGTASPGRVGQAVSTGLLGLQIAAAAGLLIVSGTMMAQANFLANRDMGYTIKDRYLATPSCPIQPNMQPDQMMATIQRCANGLPEIARRVPGARDIAFFMGNLLGDNIATQAIARGDKGEEIAQVAMLSVDLNFLQVMGAKLKAGRLFDPNSAYDQAMPTYSKNMQLQQMAAGPSTPGANPFANLPPPPMRIPVVITESLLPSLGVDSAEKAIGQQFAFKIDRQMMSAMGAGANAQQPAYEIVGVVSDWHLRPLKYQVTPVVFMPSFAIQAVMKIPESEVKGVSAQLTSAWKELSNDPNGSVNVVRLQDTLDLAYRADFRLMYALVGFAAVAILVAGLGVYGLSAFDMRRRVREIGIRKALGASPAKVAGMVIGKALLFAGIATAIAWAPGFYYAQQWLGSFVYRTPLDWVILPVVSLAIVAFVALAVSLNAARAAAVRPGLALQAS